MTNAISKCCPSPSTTDTWPGGGCQVVETGQTIPVICAINHRPPNRIEIIPCAVLLSGNPYRLVNLPRADGNGFVTLVELRGDELSASPTRPSLDSYVHITSKISQDRIKLLGEPEGGKSGQGDSKKRKVTACVRVLGSAQFTRSRLWPSHKQQAVIRLR